MVTFPADLLDKVCRKNTNTTPNKQVVPLLMPELPHVGQKPNQLLLRPARKFMQKAVKVRQLRLPKHIGKRLKPKRQHLPPVRHVLKLNAQRPPPVVQPPLRHRRVVQLRKDGLKKAKRVRLGMQPHLL